MNQKDYIEYISRLIDRDLQQKQANGFTLWAIVGVLFYLSLDIVDKVPVLLEWPYIKFYPFLIIVITINYLVFFVLFLYSWININKIIEKRKLITKFNSQNEAKYYSSILLIIVGILNLKAGYLIHSLMFKFFGSFFIYIALRSHITPYSVYTELKSFYSNPKLFYVKLKLFYIKLKSFLGILEPTPLKKPGLKLNSKPQIIQRVEYIFLVFFSIMLTIYLTLYVFTISFLLDNSADAITIAIKLFACFLLSIILVNQFIMLRAGKWLANLEHDIYIYNLNEDKIRNRLIKEYFGPTIEAWLSAETREYESVDKSIEKAQNEIESRISEMSEVQKDILNQNYKSLDAELEKYYAAQDKWILAHENTVQNIKDSKDRLMKIIETIGDKNKLLMDQEDLDLNEVQEMLKVFKIYEDNILKRIKGFDQLISSLDNFLEESEKFKTKLKEEQTTHID